MLRRGKRPPGSSLCYRQAGREHYEPQGAAAAAVAVQVPTETNLPVPISALSFNKQQRSNNIHHLLSDLKSCSFIRNLEWGRQIHVKLLENGHAHNVHVGTALVKMYAKCGSMVDAHQVFESIGQPNVVTWTTLLSGYAENGQGLTALDVFSRMKSQGCEPDSMAYVAALKACASLAQEESEGARIKCLEMGKQIHAEIGCHLNNYVQTALVGMYAKCNSMVNARQVFDSIGYPDVVSWTALILGYVENGEELTSLELFSRMKSCGCAPNSVTFVAVLKACASLARKEVGSRVQCLERGREIHSEIRSNLNLYVQNTLVDMYAKCGSMVDACQVFDSIRQPDVISWNALLLGYAENGEATNTLESFWRMKSHGFVADSLSYVAALKACTSLALEEDGTGKAECLEWGKRIHVEIGDSSDICVRNALVDMYAKGGSVVTARQIFDRTRQPDVVSWTTLILGYAENGEGRIALDLFLRMKSHGCVPDCIAYGAALKACALLGALESGRKVHAEITEFNGSLVTSLVDFYAKCGSLVEAQTVFDLHFKRRGVATWNSLLAGYGSFGEVGLVFKLFQEMQDTGLRPDSVTFLTILMCCSHAGLVEQARECFETMCSRHRLTPIVKHYNCLVDVLGRANKLDEAMVILTRMPCIPNVVTWMTILGACRKWKNVEIGGLAFHCLASMDEVDTAPYLMMAQIYASRGMWQEQEMVLGMKNESQALKSSGQTCCLLSEGGRQEHPHIGKMIML